MHCNSSIHFEPSRNRDPQAELSTGCAPAAFPSRIPRFNPVATVNVSTNPRRSQIRRRLLSVMLAVAIGVALADLAKDLLP